MAIEDTNGNIPTNLVDEYARVKIGLAAAGVATVVGVTVGVALGKIPTDNAVAQGILPVFYTLVGLAISFFFKK